MNVHSLNVNLSLKVFTDGHLTKRITNAQRLNDSEVYVAYFFGSC